MHAKPPIDCTTLPVNAQSIGRNWSATEARTRIAAIAPVGLVALERHPAAAASYPLDHRAQRKRPVRLAFPYAGQSPAVFLPVLPLAPSVKSTN